MSEFHNYNNSYVDKEWPETSIIKFIKISKKVNCSLNSIIFYVILISYEINYKIKEEIVHVSLKNICLYIGLILVVALSACSGSSTEQKIYDHLQEAVQLEKGFEEQQDLIVDLEKTEQDIYEQIADLETEESDEIKKLSKQAIESIEERSDKVALEKESIDDSRAEFEKIKELIEKIEDKEVKEKVEEMYDVMMERYESYDQLHESYLTSLEEEKTLYTLLQKEDLTQEEYTDQVTVLNEVYEQVIDKNDEMNKATNDYNALKEEFYDMAEINEATKKD